MHKISDFIKTNKIFILIALIVLMSSFVALNLQYIGKNPFNPQINLDNPVKVCEGKDSFYFISDSSKKISVTDKKFRLKYEIEAGNSDNCFEYADDIAQDSDGNIYVYDRIYSASGSIVKEERIIKFAPEEKNGEILYQTKSIDKSGNAVLKIRGLCIQDGTVYFSEIKNDGIYIYKLENNRAQECRFIKKENAVEIVEDIALNSKMETAVLFKNGDISVYNNTEENYVYKARENDTADYVSLVTEITYDDEDRLYMCDTGLREIYRMSSGYTGKETVISSGKFASAKSGNFSEQPLYTGISVYGTNVSVLVAEYRYEQETDEEIYTYNIAQVSDDGNTQFCIDRIRASVFQCIWDFAVYLALLILIVIAVYFIIKLVRFLRNIELEKSVKIQLVMVITALGVTMGVSYVIFDSCNSRFVDEVADKLLNVSYLIGESVDKQIISEIKSPDDYYTDDYKKLDESVNKVIKSKANKKSEMYCVIYKVQNDVVCEVYRDDMAHGVMYPMAGRYKDSIEEHIAAENDYDISYEFALSEGTYMYALIPVYDEDNNAVAFIETGMEYANFNKDNNALYIKVLLFAVMSVIIVVLMFSELLYGARAFVIKKKQKFKDKICSPELIRPLSFIYFFIANMSTAFLPIYGMKLWNKNFPMQSEMAAALPLTAEMICAAGAAFICGYIIRRIKVRATCVLGALFYLTGNILSAFSVNLWMLIMANSLCGIGSGFLTIAFNSWAAGYDDEEQQNRGFIHINAAYLAGLNCGTVIGSAIWEKFGIDMVYYAGAVLSGVLIIFSLIFVGKIKIVSEEEESEGSGKLKDLFTPAVIRFFLFITVPYLICTAFLEYFFPIQAEQNGLSATYISMAFLISGLISIYLGSSIAEPVTKKMGVKKAMILASFLYAAALWYLVMNPSVYSCYVVVVFFAVADSFGLSAQSVYFSSMAEVKKVGQSKALGVNSTVESITSACGSIIFGFALMLGTRRGIMLIAGVFALLLLLFVLGETNKKKC